MLSQLNRCIDINEILHGDTFILEEEFFTVITDMHADGVAGKS